MIVLALWWSILYLFVVGMAAGWLAWVVLGKKKALSSGRKPNWPLLLGIGVAGSFFAGLVLNLVQGFGFELRASGMIASSLGAIALAAIYLSLVGNRKN